MVSGTVEGKRARGRQRQTFLSWIGKCFDSSGMDIIRLAAGPKITNFYKCTFLKVGCGLHKHRYQMFQPIFARDQWPETFKASFARTNQTVNKRGRQKKCVKNFLNFTTLHKMQPGQKTAGNFPNFLLNRRYGLSKTDEALNLKQ